MWLQLFWYRFDGKDFLNRWKGKKIMFVGDSLSLNMWESLACMIHASVPNAKTSFLRKESLSTVTFQVCFCILYLCLLLGLVNKSPVFTECKPHTFDFIFMSFVCLFLCILFHLWFMSLVGSSISLSPTPAMSFLSLAVLHFY